jgi:Na+-transporting methylmalonyl-CoA/oxaloacetate decarboxylase gamma subunit
MKTIVVIILGLMLLYCGMQIFGKPASVQVPREAPQEMRPPVQTPPEAKQEYVMVITEVIEEVEE